MAENIDGKDLFGSGVHSWQWGPRPRARKTLRTIGAAGEAGWPIQVGGRPCRIAGVLKTSGHNDRSLADSAMNTLVIAITDLIDSGKACAWIDDRDQSGSSLQIVGFRRIGPRRYTRDGADWGVWYEYQCDLIELSGAGRQ